MDKFVGWMAMMDDLELEERERIRRDEERKRKEQKRKEQERKEQERKEWQEHERQIEQMADSWLWYENEEDQIIEDESEDAFSYLSDQSGECEDIFSYLTLVEEIHNEVNALQEVVDRAEWYKGELGHLTRSQLQKDLEEEGYSLDRIQDALDIVCV